MPTLSLHGNDDQIVPLGAAPLCLMTFKFSDCLLLFAVGATKLAILEMFKEPKLEGVAREVEATIVKMIQEAVAG